MNLLSFLCSIQGFLSCGLVRRDPGAETAAPADCGGKAVRLHHGADGLRRPEMALHEQELLGDGDELHGGQGQVRLLDQDSSAWFQNADQLRDGRLHAGEVVKGKPRLAKPVLIG